MSTRGAAEVEVAAGAADVVCLAGPEVVVASVVASAGAADVVCMAGAEVVVASTG